MNNKMKKTIAVGSIATVQAVSSLLTANASKCIGAAVVKTLEFTPAGKVAFLAGNTLLTAGCELGINTKFEALKEDIKNHFSKEDETEDIQEEETLELTVLETVNE